MRHSAALLGAPLPSLTPPHLLAEAMAEPVASEQEGLPIFESVESEYLDAYGANRLGLSDAEAGAPAQGGRPAELVPGTTVHRSATAAVSAQIARTRLTSFQQGSRRARAEAQTARETERTWEDSEGARGSGLS